MCYKIPTGISTWPNIMSFNAMVYGLHCLIWALYAAVPFYALPSEANEVRRAIAGAAAILTSLWFFLVAGVTCAYGIKTRAALNRVPVEMLILESKLGEIRGLASVSTVCFILRALTILYGQIEPWLQLETPVRIA